jgi:hypothetical protein
MQDYLTTSWREGHGGRSILEDLPLTFDAKNPLLGIEQRLEKGKKYECIELSPLFGLRMSFIAHSEW